MNLKGSGFAFAIRRPGLIAGEMSGEDLKLSPINRNVYSSPSEYKSPLSFTGPHSKPTKRITNAGGYKPALGKFARMEALWKCNFSKVNLISIRIRNGHQWMGADLERTFIRDKGSPFLWNVLIAVFGESNDHTMAANWAPVIHLRWRKENLLPNQYELHTMELATSTNRIT